MDPSTRRLSRDDYTVAIICPMGVELAAMEGMLDEMDESLPTRRDQNNYTLGRIGAHNVVVAVMPGIGNNRAASVGIQLLNDFSSIRFGLLVGIGGGIPGKGDEDDIRLGDVVVSKPTGTFGGVVQYDTGKVTKGGLFQRTGSLNKPPTLLRASVHRMQAQHHRVDTQIPTLLLEMVQKYPKMNATYAYPGVDHDHLFEATYAHQGGSTCQNCNPTRVVPRKSRPDSAPQIHYGTIASGNAVIKDATTRDRLRQDLGALCVEMEAAGLMDEFPCLVIRGICDYADSHKNEKWQPYAAATAAAYTKELLSLIAAKEISTMPKTRFRNKYYEVPRNPTNFFTERDQIYIPLQKACLPSNITDTPPCQVRCVLFGLGGSGKTQFCLKFAEEHREKYVSPASGVSCIPSMH
jgi:nucleoside phosphorylase